MGTIYIEEYGNAGTNGQRDVQVPDLNTLLALTKDATTSNTAESITLNAGTRVVSVYAAEAHRLCIGSDTTATIYAYIPATTRLDFGVNAGDTLYYELDA